MNDAKGMKKVKPPDLSGGEFAYLGHFRKPENVKKGHNDFRSLVGMAPKKSLFEQEMAKAAAPPPATVAPVQQAPATVAPDTSMRRKQIDESLRKAGG